LHAERKSTGYKHVYGGWVVNSMIEGVYSLGCTGPKEEERGRGFYWCFWTVQVAWEWKV
jgi:hypothetical protein